jgi:hypothetical protein
MLMGGRGVKQKGRGLMTAKGTGANGVIKGKAGIGANGTRRPDYDSQRVMCFVCVGRKKAGPPQLYINCCSRGSYRVPRS